MSGDKLQALTGIEFKRAVPTIRDDDPDLDRLDREFDNVGACCSYGTILMSSRSTVSASWMALPEGRCTKMSVGRL